MLARTLGGRASSIARLAVLALGLWGCGRDARGADASADRQRALDSALTAFRAALPPTAALSHGEPTREALVRRFVSALARADTADMRHMLITRAEFAYLYYPTSPFATRQPAGLWWFMNIENSRTGITRLFDRLSGREMSYVGHRCPTSTAEGMNRTHDRCVVTIRVARDTITARLFGSILERDGRFKFMGYGNDF